MRELRVDDNYHEISDLRVGQLYETGAILPTDEDDIWLINASHTFTYQEVLWLMDTTETGDP